MFVSARSRTSRTRTPNIISTANDSIVTRYKVRAVGVVEIARFRDQGPESGLVRRQRSRQSIAALSCFIASTTRTSEVCV